MNEIQQPIKEEQHYEHKRGQIYTVEHLNDDIALLYDGRHYRLERRKYFEREVESGMYELKPDLEINQSDEEIPLHEIDLVGDVAIESLNRVGITTPKQFDYVTDEEILKLDGVGKKSLANIREWIENQNGQTVEL